MNCNDKKSLIKSSGSVKFVRKSNDFVLVKWVEDMTFSVICIKNVIINDINDIVIDKVYDIEYGKKSFCGVVKFIGTKSACDAELDKISEYPSLGDSGPRGFLPKKKLTTSDVVAKAATYENEEDVYLKKIEELELRLNTKNIEIARLNEQMEKREKILACYENTFDEESIQKFLN
ncbi:unnamed protein product [Brachionus calyciflorus]|uniref:Uncharacterized protein n=1 Tax=Brachionus calyciflorus TaxID=104777 RepID=A0A814QDD1_9BILA|nr:unnamed protein product [Brachionus calyciflorus]